MGTAILAATGWRGILQLITAFLIFIFVLAVTIFTTRWIGNFQKTRLTGQNLEVIETMGLMNNKIIAIIRAGEDYLVIAICKDTITVLHHLKEEQLDLSQKMIKQDLPGFSEILEKLRTSSKGQSSREVENNHDGKEKY